MNETQNYMLQNAIPFSGYGNIAPGENPTVMEMRWETQNLTVSLWQQLAGRVVTVIDGKAHLVHEIDPSKIEPLMNDKGARDIINVVRGFVNPVVALSNITDDEAGLIFNQCFEHVVSAINQNQEEYGIKNVASMEIIVASIIPILFCQIKRPVSGHESKNSKTQYSEGTVSASSTTQNKGGFTLNPFK